MLLLRTLELALGTGLVIFIVWQIVLPLLRGRHVFPMFRYRDLEERRSQAEEALERARTEQEVENLEKKAKTMRTKPKGVAS